MVKVGIASAEHFEPLATGTRAGVLLQQPVILPSLNKGQSRVVYTISSSIVMKITTRLEEHGEEHSMSIQFSEFRVWGLGFRY